MFVALWRIYLMPKKDKYCAIHRSIGCVQHSSVQCKKDHGVHILSKPGVKQSCYKYAAGGNLYLLS